jgi:hypothetical protein
MNTFLSVRKNNHIPTKYGCKNNHIPIKYGYNNFLHAIVILYILYVPLLVTAGFRYTILVTMVSTMHILS